MIRVSHVLIASIGMTGLALAQPPPPPGPPAPVEAPGASSGNTIGVDAAFVLPTGDYADGVDAAFGVFGRVEFQVNPQLAVTGRLGGLLHAVSGEASDADVSITMLLLYGGIRYNLSTSRDGVFLLGEAGLNNIRISVQGESVDETSLTFNAGGGFQSGKLQFRGSLFFTASAFEDLSNGDGTNLIGLMATVGYDFASF